MSREVMILALEALESAHPRFGIGTEKYHQAITALRAALDAPEPEPFGYFQYAPHFDAWVQNRDGNVGTAFYTAPVAFFQLTDAEIQQCKHLHDNTAGWSLDTFARAIEKKLKEKNT